MTSTTETTLQVDDKLSLIAPEDKHAKELFDLVSENKDYLSQYLAWPPHINEVSQMQQFIESARAINQNQQGLVLLVQYDGQIAGVISFNSIDVTNKTAYIGYWLGQSFQKKGITTASVNKLVEEYSKTGNIQRFVIKTTVFNESSNTVAKRCGFEYEGTLKHAEVIGGKAYDQNLYAKVVA